MVASLLGNIPSASDRNHANRPIMNAPPLSVFDGFSLCFGCVVGDILVFMPGQEDIEVTCEALGGKYYFSYLGIFIFH